MTGSRTRCATLLGVCGVPLLVTNAARGRPGTYCCVPSAGVDEDLTERRDGRDDALTRERLRLRALVLVVARRDQDPADRQVDAILGQAANSSLTRGPASTSVATTARRCGRWPVARSVHTRPRRIRMSGTFAAPICLRRGGAPTTGRFPWQLLVGIRFAECRANAFDVEAKRGPWSLAEPYATQLARAGRAGRPGSESEGTPEAAVGRPVTVGMDGRG
jgi:hypothetical protein